MSAQQEASRPLRSRMDRTVRAGKQVELDREGWERGGRQYEVQQPELKGEQMGKREKRKKEKLNLKAGAQKQGTR